MKWVIDILFHHRKDRQYTTVRYAFPFALAFSLAIGLAAVTSSDTSYIRIETIPESVLSGENFEINVYVSAHTAVNAIDLAISLPRDQITVEGIDTGESVITLWTEEPYESNGVVYLRGGTYRRGFTGEHLVAKIQARAAESGSAYVSTKSAQLLAGDGLGTEVPVSVSADSNARIYIAHEDGSLVGEASVHIVTDIDGDGDVDMSDIYSFMAAWRARTTTFDFNGDGKMSFRDFGIILAHFFLK